MIEHPTANAHGAPVDGDTPDRVNSGDTGRNAEIERALECARELARVGIPLFVAHPDPAGRGHNNTGYWFPAGWDSAAADPSVVDRWQPGWALCAVMGRGLDLIDFDPRSGGDPALLSGSMPRSYAIAATPSDGMHSFILSTGSGSRDGVFPGIDVKSGMADGSGRGFAFLAPTVRPSKVTGEPTPYRWLRPPDIGALSAVLQGSEVDTSGQALAAHIRELKADSGVAKLTGPDWWREFLLNKEPQSQAAAERAITAKLTEVREWTPSSGANFRTVLLRAAMTLGGYVGGGYLEEDAARDRLVEAAEVVWGTADSDDHLWITQGLTDGAVAPFYVYTPADELAFSEVAQAAAARAEAGSEPPWTVYDAIGTAPFDPAGDGTDQGLAERVAERMYPALRYAADAGTWLVRGREVWREREDMSGWAVSTLARLMPLGETPVPKELTARTEGHWQAVRRARFMDSGGSGKVERKFRSIVRNVDHPGAVELSDLDADPEILWAGGRAWDLRASLAVPVQAELDPNTPHLRNAACAPDVVPTPYWDAFLAAVWPDPELRAWALRVLSITLAGYPDAALPMLYGPERTGKTSVVQLIVKVLGSYGHAADPRLLAGADNSHASVVYALKGRRLSFIDEGPRRGHLATERLKQLTGGGSLTGNAMRANPITFEPTHTLVMTTNDEPPLTDPALRARARVIPSEGDQAAVRAARQALSPAIWYREAPGVLAVLMRECAAWIADPDTANSDRAPGSVLDAVDDMAARQSPAREWVGMCTVPADPGTPGRELYRRFVEWFEVQAIYRKQTPPTETAFGRTLTEMGFPSVQVGSMGNRKWYRPLSVFGGGGGRAPWEPELSTAPVDGFPGTGRVQGGSAAGSGPEPALPENPSSTPVSYIDRAGRAGKHTSTSSTTTTHNTNGVVPTPYIESTGETGTRPAAPTPPAGNPSVDLQRQAGQVTPPTTRPGPDTPGPGRVAPVDSPVDQGQTAPDLRKLAEALSAPSVTPIGDAPSPKPAKPREPTAAEVAARAYQGGDEKKITKAEARRQLKAELRLAAIAEAGGEVLTLPAGVGRGGAVVALSLDDAASMVRAAIRRSGALTVDVETTGYPVGHADYGLRTVQLGDATVAVVFDADDEAQRALVRTLIAEAPRLHAHSATADLVPLEHAGLIEAESAWDRMHDTVIPAKLGDPQSTGSDPALKQLAGVVLGPHAVSPVAEAGRKAVFQAGKWLEETKVDTPIARSGWAQIDKRSSAMVRYAAADVLDTGALSTALPPVPPAVHERERLAQRMTARVTHRGVLLDAEHVATKTEVHSAKRVEHAAQVRGLLGVENPGSDVQIAKALLARGAPLPISKKGNPSVAAEVLLKLKRTEFAEIAQAVLDFRHHDTVLGTFLGPYRVLCERGDGRARPTIYTLGTDTGRMSCVRPNLQQLPREGGVRKCIIADPGQLMIGADFSSVELRVAAALSQDPQLMAFIAAEDAFNAEIAMRARAEGITEKLARAAILAERGLRHGGNADGLHWVIARQIWGDDATKGHRYVAKRMVFGRIYGGGVPTLAAQVGVADSEGQAVVDTLDRLTPGLTQWSTMIRNAVKQGHTKFPSYSGRIIHLPREYPHKGPNYAIQGTARELLIDALVRWAQTRWGNATILPVHDELDAFVPADEAADATATLIECMRSELYGVQIVADPSEPSPFWADAA